MQIKRVSPSKRSTRWTMIPLDESRQLRVALDQKAIPLRPDPIPPPLWYQARSSGTETPLPSMPPRVQRYGIPFPPTEAEPNGSASTPTPPETGQVADFIKKFGVVGTVYKGSDYIITGLNTATPAQLAAELQRYHLVNDPSLANQQAGEMLGHAQTKGANAILMGLAAGVMTYTTIDLIKPKWPIAIKLLISALMAAAVSSLIWFGLRDRDPKPEPVYIPPYVMPSATPN